MAYDRYCIGLMLLLLWPVMASGQNQKIGFIDSDSILELMPEYDGIEQRLRVLSESWQEELTRMDREIEELEELFEAREILYTDEIREERIEEIEMLRRERDEYLEQRFGPDGDYFQQQKELLEPLQRDVFQAVQRVARQEGFDFIFDRTRDVRFLYAEPEWNVTNRVIEELGLENLDDSD
jgi:outer membrane protein